MDQKEIKTKIDILLEKIEMIKVKHTKISNFSKGMKQKLLIIASLIHNPDLIFFDEPLAGLDANSVMIVKEMWDQLSSAGKTIFYSPRIMDVEEKIGDRIFLLIKGMII